MERMLKAQTVKFLGQDSIECHQKGEKRREEADYGSRVCAGEQTAERLQTGYECEVWGRTDLARR